MLSKFINHFNICLARHIVPKMETKFSTIDNYTSVITKDLIVTGTENVDLFKS